MKLLFTQDALINAGTERSNLELISRFSKDLEVGVVYFYPHHELSDDYERAGIRLFFLDIPEKYHLFKGVWELIKLIKMEKPDLLVSSLWRADIITRIASLITGVPLVGTMVNDSYAPIAWTDKEGFKYKVVYWLDRLTAGIPFHWIANAQALADSHLKTLGIAQQKISVVYRGRAVPVIGPEDGDLIGSDAEQPSIDHEIASASEGHIMRSEQIDSSLTPQRAGASMSKIRNFISYGRLLERKGFQDAIQAFSQVLKKYSDCTLTIFGEGPYRKNLESLIQELELQASVFLPGKIPNPMEVLINGYCPLPTLDCPLFTGDCFLFPSWYEGFSGALVEAMMAGIPIIASDIPMNLEAVTDKKSALVFPVQNIGFLKGSMLWAIENPDQMKAIGNAARLSAIDRFDIEKIAVQYEQTLLRIAGQVKQS